MSEQKIETNRLLVNRFYHELLNDWQFDIISDLLSPDLVFHGSLGTPKTGHEGFIEYANHLRSAFPDFKNSVEDIIAEEQKVAACLTFRGTHEGEIFGIEPTGRTIQFVGVGIFVFRADLISHIWVLGDRLSLLQQLSDRDPITE